MDFPVSKANLLSSECLLILGTGAVCLSTKWSSSTLSLPTCLIDSQRSTDGGTTAVFRVTTLDFAVCLSMMIILVAYSYDHRIQ